MAISLRLDNQTEKAVERCAKLEGCSKSELIRHLIRQFLVERKNKLSAWDLGKNVFGTESSGKGNLSTDRKAIVRELIHAKKSRH